MNSVTMTEFRYHFSSVISQVKQGKEFVLINGKNRENIAVITPFPSIPLPERRLGVLKGRGPLVIAEDFQLSEEEFLLQ